MKSIFASNSTIRVKVIGRCNLSCSFCHKEGGDAICPFSVNQMERVVAFADQIGFSKVHLTGGEPSLHPQITDLIGVVKSRGLNCSVTTNGQFNSRVAAALYATNPTSINFSLPTVDQKVWCKLQPGCSSEKAIRQIHRLLANITAAVSAGIKTKVNIAVSDVNPALEAIHAAKNSGSEVRIMDILGNTVSLHNVSAVLRRLKAEVETEQFVVGSSQSTILFQTIVGTVGVKIINPNFHLNSVCGSCTRKCLEGFYGIRVESVNGDIFVRLCLQDSSEQTYIRLAEFSTSEQLNEILRSQNQVRS